MIAPAINMGKSDEYRPLKKLRPRGSVRTASVCSSTVASRNSFQLQVNMKITNEKTAGRLLYRVLSTWTHYVYNVDFVTRMGQICVYFVHCVHSFHTNCTQIARRITRKFNLIDDWKIY